MDKIDHYIDRRTIIIGEVNSGKTSKTLDVVTLFLKSGYADKMAILDLAPDVVRGIGGKMVPTPNELLLYLTTSIIAPRLTGKDESHTLGLAEKNARAIEKLFKHFLRHQKEILFVNDATLYLQAGDLERFINVLDSTTTQIINAYYGDTFFDSELTRREKKLTEVLIALCDQVIRLPF